MELNDFPPNLIEKTMKKALKKTKRKRKQNEDQLSKIHLYLPYEKGISEKIQRLSSKYNVQVIHTKGKSLQSELRVNKSNFDNKKNIQGAVYKISCMDCEKSYIGETGRTIETRLKEHKQDITSNRENVSGLSKHLRESKHTVDWDSINILHRENDFRKRKFKEAVAIRKTANNILNKKEEIKIISSIWETLI